MPDQNRRNADADFGSLKRRSRYKGSQLTTLTDEEEIQYITQYNTM